MQVKNSNYLLTKALSRPHADIFWKHPCPLTSHTLVAAGIYWSRKFKHFLHGPNETWRKKLKTCMFGCMSVCNQCKNNGKHLLMGSNTAVEQNFQGKSSPWWTLSLQLQHLIYTEKKTPPPHITKNCIFRCWIYSHNRKRRYFNENL